MLTKTDMAEHMGITQAGYAQIGAAKRPCKATLQKAAEAFGITLEQLAYGDATPWKPQVNVGFEQHQPNRAMRVLSALIAPFWWIARAMRILINLNTDSGRTWTPKT